MANNIQFVVLGDVTDLQNKLNSLKKNFDDITKYSAIGFSVLTASSLGFINAAEKQNLAINQLNQALRNQGNYTDQTTDSLQNYASTLADTTLFSETAIIQSESIIASFGFQADVVMQLTKATADLAQAKGIDLASAADLVAKSVGSDTNALARYGIIIDGAAGSTARANSFIQVSGRLFGGQALAATQGLGSIVQLKNQMDELSVSIGNALAPSVIGITKNLKSFFDTASSNQFTKLISNFLVFGIEVTALGLSIGILGKSITSLAIAWGTLNAVSGLSVFANGGLNTDIGILITNVGLLYPGLILIGVAFASWNLAKLLLDMNGLNGALTANQDIISKLIASSNNNQIKEIADYTAKSLAAHNQTMAQIQEEEAAKIAQINAEVAATAAAEKKKQQLTSQTEQFLQTNAGVLTSISETQTQAQLTDYITKLGQEKAALIEDQNLKLQVLKNNGILTVTEEKSITQQKTDIDTQYNTLTVLATSQLQDKLNSYQAKGLEVYKQTQADQLGTLTNSLQQAASLNKGFAIAYQVFAVSQAIVNTALGVTAALAKADFISAAIIAASGGIQVATILSQSFAVGTASVPQDMMAQIHKKEMIIPATFSDSIRRGDLSLSGKNSNENNNAQNSGSTVIFDFTNAKFNGITDGLVKNIFKKAGENLKSRKLTALPV